MIDQFRAIGYDDAPDPTRATAPQVQRVSASRARPTVTISPGDQPDRGIGFNAHGGWCEPPQIEAHHDDILSQAMTPGLGKVVVVHR